MAGNLLQVEGQLLSTVDSSVSPESAEIVPLINLSVISIMQVKCNACVYYLLFPIVSIDL